LIASGEIVDDCSPISGDSMLPKFIGSGISGRYY
jgi:hypothetical protein